MATIEFNGTGGLMEGDFGRNGININLDSNFKSTAFGCSSNFGKCLSKISSNFLVIASNENFI